MKAYYVVPAAELGQKIEDTRVGEDAIALHNKEYQALFGKTFKERGAKPSARGIVRISMTQSGDSPSVYRKFRGATGVESTQAVVTWTTLYEIIGKSEWPSESSSLPIYVEPLVSKWGRALFYWNHPDDAARVSYKLGMIGILLGVLSLIFDWEDILRFFSCLFAS